MIGDMLMIVCLWYSRECGVCGAQHRISIAMYYCPRCGQDNTTPQDFAQRSINVSNLHATVTASQLFSMFNQVGKVMYAFMLDEVTATDGSQSGVVQYNEEEEAAEAAVRCDGLELVGRPMKVSYSGQDIKCVASRLVA